MWVSPRNTQSKHVLKADSDPEEPHHRHERLYSWKRQLLGADQHSLVCQSLGQPDDYMYFTNASICDRMGPDRMEDWWWLWAALPLSLPESFHDDLICWDPPFCVRKVGLQNRQCHWLSWSDVVSVSAVLYSLLWMQWKMSNPTELKPYNLNLTHVSTTGGQLPKSEWCVTVPGVWFENETHLVCVEHLYQCGARYDEALDISCTFGPKDIAWQNVLASSS